MTRLGILLLLALAALSPPAPVDAHTDTASALLPAVAPAPPSAAAGVAVAETDGPEPDGAVGSGGDGVAGAGFLPGRAPEPTRAGPTSPWSTGAVGLAVVAALVLAGGRLGARRAVVVVALATTLAFAFESGVHSVHHLGERSGAAECAMATAASTVTGIADMPSAWTAVPAPTSSVLADGHASRAPVSAGLPFQGRAPPRT